MERFDCEDLFLQALIEGITLFCGAGFSIHSYDNDMKKLPLGDALLSELKEHYGYINNYSTLSRACTKITKNDKSSFYSFLKTRFSVSSYDEIYKCINKINIKSIYTTNIDDLFFKIFESDSGRRLHNRVNGEEFNNNLAIDYYPLHGCVREENSEYVFGAIELASAFSRNDNHQSWASLAKDSSKNPILFWGWNFEDPGPIEAMYGKSNGFEDNIRRWVLLHYSAANEEMIDYLEALNFNIIIGDTRELLLYIQDKISIIQESYEKTISESSEKQLSKYLIPENDDRLPKYSITSYFKEYSPQWSHIYSGAVPKTKYYTRLIDYISSGKDVFITGIRCSGKTTLLMQAAIELKSKKPIHFMSAPSIEEIEMYIQILEGAQTILFVDNCFRDTDAVCKILETTNIQGVFSDRDFNFERQYHRISSFSVGVKMLDITELHQSDAQKIISAIPNDIKRARVNMNSVMKDPTILNLMVNSLKPTDFRFINDFIAQDEEAARVFLVVCYVHSCGVPCSFDMLYSFLGDDLYTWSEMYEIINRVGGLIKSFSEGELSFEYSQDYFICRSQFLAEKIISSIPHGNIFFREVLEDFTKYVPQYKICQYDKFRRSAYDTKIAVTAYNNNLEKGEDFYNLCSEKDNSEYIFQQAALYFSKLGDYTLAFYWIDKARNISHYNRFSIDSTYAQIYFDANFESDSESQLKEALDILYKCCKSDKRRNIHIVAFVNRVIRYHEKFRNDSSHHYIEMADYVVTEALEKENQALCQKNRWEIGSLQKKLKNYI